MRFLKGIIYLGLIILLGLFAFSWISGAIIGTALYYIEGGMFRLSDLGTMFFCLVVSVLLVAGVVILCRKFLNIIKGR